MRGPGIHYARSGEFSIAYRVAGSGPPLLMVPGWVSHVDADPPFPQWATDPARQRLPTFATVITIDKRGTGASDRVPSTLIPTLEERVDDLRAVLDDAGVERTAIFGGSEGGPLAILFASLYPHRVTALFLSGSYAKFDFETSGMAHYGTSREDFLERVRNEWGQTMSMIEVVAPSLAHDPEMVEGIRRWCRMCASPDAAAAVMTMALDIDVRPLLSTVQVPTTVFHIRGDLNVPFHHGEFLAAHIPGARLIAIDGTDHAGTDVDWSIYADEVERSLTGTVSSAPIERVLSTVLFTDIVDSTVTAARVGDGRWRELLDHHDKITADAVQAHRGRLVKLTGDGALVTFDGPARAIRCAQDAQAGLQDHGIQIRAGVHTGEIELRDEDIGGLGVHIAARVLGLAGPEEVMTTRTVKDLVAGSGIEFSAAGEHELKGVPDRWETFLAR